VRSSSWKVTLGVLVPDDGYLSPVAVAIQSESFGLGVAPTVFNHRYITCGSRARNYVSEELALEECKVGHVAGLATSFRTSRTPSHASLTLLLAP
jgi:hypothetical protein